MKTCYVLVFLLALGSKIEGKPAVDAEPIKFSLDTGDEKASEKSFKSDVSISLQNGRELASEAQNNVAGAIGAANDIIERSRTTFQSLAPKTRETAKLESENDQAFFEKKKTNPLSSLLENVLKPKPIVDNIKEEEKYGNNGDKFIGVGRALVNGFEGLSNFVNAIVDLPVNAAKKTSRGITEALNHLGARLVGLQ